MKKQRRNLIPLLTGDVSEQELLFSERLDGLIVGQDDAKLVAARAYRTAQNPIRDKRRPVKVVLLIGKTTTGKTLTARSFAEIVHGDPDAMVMVNCGAYKEKHRVAQLLGAPPSYVGYTDPRDPKNAAQAGKPDPSAKFSQANLDASRKGSDSPIIVVCLDEIEKASQDLEDVLLSIFRDGKVELGNNTVTDFTNCVFFITSNLAMDEVERQANPMGFRVDSGRRKVTEKDVRAVVERQLKIRYKPEFLKRIDETVIFAELTAEQERLVVDIEVTRLEERIFDQLDRGLCFTLEVDEAAREFILARSREDSGDVADIKLAMSRYIEEPLGNELIKRTIGLGDLVVVGHQDGADRLSFLLGEGQGEVSDADTLMVFAGDSEESRKGLGFQRRVSRAKKLAAQEGRESFVVSVSEDTQTDLAELGADLMSDMKEIYGIEVIGAGSTFKKPFKMTFQVEAHEEQIKALVSKWTVATAVKTPSDGQKAS